MPDQTTQPPTKRMTTAEVAALAQGLDERLDDLSAIVTDLSTRLQDIGALSERAADGGASGWLTRDQLAQYVHETLTPLHDEVHELRQRGDDQNTRAALRVAESVDNTVTELSEQVGQLAQRIQERETAHAELRDDIMGRLSGVRPDDAPTRDQVDERIHEALQPLHDELHEIRQRAPLTSATGNLNSILARLEAAERRVAAVEPGAITEQVATHLHPTMSNLRQRVTALEAEAEKGADPASNTLAEYDLTDQIQAAVERKVQEMFAGTGAAPAEIASTAVALDNLKKRVNWLTEQLADTQAVNGAPIPVVLPHATGAAKKVLQLMRAVTHIDKGQEANLGQGGRFKFRGVDDAMDAVGHAMRDVGVILGTEILKDETRQTPITKAGTNKDGTRWENTVVWTSTKLTVRYTFTDPEDGSTHSLEMTGEGRDASDKSTSKAASMALKYGLFQALMIPVTGLDDSDAAPPQRMEQDGETPAAPSAPAPAQQAPPVRTEQQKAQRAAEALEAIRNVYRVAGGPQAQYNRLVQIMNQVSSEKLLQFTVEGSTLDQHGQAAMRTLQAPPPPDDARASTEPPEPPEDYR